jgi:hypothetical protein
LGKDNRCAYLIGGNTPEGDGGITTPSLHTLELAEAVLIRSQRFTLIYIRLFAPLGLLKYHVVFRQRPLE